MTTSLLYRAVVRATEDEDNAARYVALEADYRGGRLPQTHLDIYRRARARRERLGQALADRIFGGRV